MSLLFKPTKNKTSKVIKRQSGGTIPFYAPFEVQIAKTPVANPSSLLKLYGSTGGSEVSQSQSDNAGKSDDAFKPKGLSNEVNYALNDLSQMKQALQDGINTMGPEFLNTPTARDWTRKINEKSAQYMVTLENNQKEWENAKKDVSSIEKDGMSSFIYNNGKFLARDLTKNGDVTPISPEEIDVEVDLGNGQKAKKYSLLNYGEGFDNRANLPSTYTVFNNNLTSVLADGRGENYVFNKIDKAFSDIGYISNDHKWISKVSGFSIDEKVMKEIVEGESSKDNKAQLLQALNEVKARLSKADLNALEAKAWLTPTTFVLRDEKGKEVGQEFRKPKSYNEVVQSVNEMLVLPMAKRIDASFTSLKKDADFHTPIKGAKESGLGGSDAVKPKGRLSGDLWNYGVSGEKMGMLETFTPENLKTPEARKKFIDEGFNYKNLLTRFPLNPAPAFTSALDELHNKVVAKRVDKDGDPKLPDNIESQDDPYFTYSELKNTGWNKVDTNPFGVNLDKAIFQNGEGVQKLADDPNNPDDNEWKEHLLIKNDEVQLAFLPVDEKTGKLWKPDSKEVQAYNDKVTKFIESSSRDKQYLINGKLNTDAVIEQLKRMSNEFYSTMAGKGVKMKSFMHVKGKLKDVDVDKLTEVFKGSRLLKNVGKAGVFSWDNFDGNVDLLIPTPEAGVLDNMEGVDQYVPVQEATYKYNVEQQDLLNSGVQASGGFTTGLNF